MQEHQSHGPRYVSQSEWRSGRQKKRMSRVRLLLFGLVIGVLGGVCYCAYRIVSLNLLRNNLVSKLHALENYQLKIYRASPSGGTQLWSIETHRDKDWDLELFGGQLEFQKVGETYFCRTFDPARTTTSSSWTGLKAFVLRLADQISRLKFLTLFQSAT